MGEDGNVAVGRLDDPACEAKVILVTVRDHDPAHVLDAEPDAAEPFSEGLRSLVAACARVDERDSPFDLLDRVALKKHLVSQRHFVLRLLENPNLMEHERFTDLLWAVHHLEEELQMRTTLTDLMPADEAHLEMDARRAFNALLAEWLVYVQHLKSDYPYLFSMVVRTHPFQDAPSPVVTA